MDNAKSYVIIKNGSELVLENLEMEYLKELYAKIGVELKKRIRADNFVEVATEIEYVDEGQLAAKENDSYEN